jgi:hypothetical protein
MLSGSTSTLDLSSGLPAENLKMLGRNATLRITKFLAACSPEKSAPRNGRFGKTPIASF